MIPEAPLHRGEHGIEVGGEGWYVLNAREARWYESDGLGAAPALEPREARFPELGVHIEVVQPGQPNCMYHREDAQEDFLVVDGEAVLIVEGEERALRAWDFVHCPAGTNHVIVGAGDGPCVFIAVGKRPQSEIVYPVDETARRYDAGVEQETNEPDEAYARFAELRQRAYREGDLPDLG